MLEEGSFPVNCPSLDTVWLPKLVFSHYDTYDCYYSYSLHNTEHQLVGDGTVLFCAPKHFHFLDRKLKIWQEGNEIVVKADAYARSVELITGADVLLEDNYFDLNACVRRIKILRGEVKDLRVRSVFDIR